MRVACNRIALPYYYQKLAAAIIRRIVARMQEDAWANDCDASRISCGMCFIIELKHCTRPICASPVQFGPFCGWHGIFY